VPCYRVAEHPGIRVIDLGLACCALEVESAVRLGLLVPEAEHPQPERTVLLVAGTVTVGLVPAVQAAVDAEPGEVAIMAFGACASTGGPYWDAPSVLNGVDRLAEVETYVPGCPPSPRALIDALVGRTAVQVQA
jgi:NADH-quinone oxidoreductase subunit B